MTEPRARIVIPDDFPVVFTGTRSEAPLRALGDVAIFTERGADREDELIRRVADARVVLSLRAYARFTKRVMESSPRLEMIALWGSGTDNVDLAAASARGIVVSNTPGVNAHAVAEHTLALMLAFARRIPQMDAAVRHGQWPHDQLMQLEGKTVGILGMGAIGARVAQLAAPFGMRLLAASRGPDDGRASRAGATHVSLDRLLAESDFVSLHWRLSAETRGIIGRAELARMKPTAVLVNTARAALVDRDALIEALRDQRIAGAALDVFHDEPIAADDPLLSLPNVVLTPHNAGSTPEVIDEGLAQAVENVAHFLRGTPRNVVSRGQTL
jgi:phosphoglycerate dehydrogenase-like enzyme